MPENDFFQHLRQLLDFIQKVNNLYASFDEIEVVHDRLNTAYSVLCELCEGGHEDGRLDIATLATHVRSVKENWRNVYQRAVADRDIATPANLPAEVRSTGLPGRPAYQIQREQVFLNSRCYAKPQQTS